MKEIVEKIESLLRAISEGELRKNSKASAKALEVKRMISGFKNNMPELKTENQGVLKYISPKQFLEN